MEPILLQANRELAAPKATKKLLLMCGTFSSLLYVIMNILGALLYKGYSSTSQTVSELSAIGTPTRPLWVLLGLVYTLLVTAFGFGVRQSGAYNRPLRITGALLIIYGIIGLGWPLAPMHQREVLATGGRTLTDTIHIVFSAVTVLLMLIAIGFGAMALGKRFRLYSIATIIILVLAGVWTSKEGAKLDANLPTPWLGVVERMLICIFLLWIVVLTIVLLRRNVAQGNEPAGFYARYNRQTTHES